MIRGMVISLEMIEMKWVIADLNQTTSVKEQRVDGSSVIFIYTVRCTLVAGKPVLGRNRIYFFYSFQYKQLHFHIITTVYNKCVNKFDTLELVKRIESKEIEVKLYFF